MYLARYHQYISATKIPVMPVVPIIPVIQAFRLFQLFRPFWLAGLLTSFWLFGRSGHSSHSRSMHIFEERVNKCIVRVKKKRPKEVFKGKDQWEMRRVTKMANDWNMLGTMDWCPFASVHLSPASVHLSPASVHLSPVSVHLSPAKEGHWSEELRSAVVLLFCGECC